MKKNEIGFSVGLMAIQVL